MARRWERKKISPEGKLVEFYAVRLIELLCSLYLYLFTDQKEICVYEQIEKANDIKVEGFFLYKIEKDQFPVLLQNKP